MRVYQTEITIEGRKPLLAIFKSNKRKSVSKYDGYVIAMSQEEAERKFEKSIKLYWARDAVSKNKLCRGDFSGGEVWADKIATRVWYSEDINFQLSDLKANCSAEDYLQYVGYWSGVGQAIREESK